MHIFPLIQRRLLKISPFVEPYAWHSTALFICMSIRIEWVSTMCFVVLYVYYCKYWQISCSYCWRVRIKGSVKICVKSHKMHTCSILSIPYTRDIYNDIIKIWTCVEFGTLWFYLATLYITIKTCFAYIGKYWLSSD